MNQSKFHFRESKRNIQVPKIRNHIKNPRAKDMLQATIYRICKFSYLKSCRESEYSLHVTLHESFSFSKKR